MVAVKRIDAHTLESVNKKGSKVTTTQRNVLAADGKTRTVTTTAPTRKVRRSITWRCTRSSKVMAVGVLWASTASFIGDYTVP